VAHDFNNLLMAIRGYGELVQAALPPAAPTAADVAEMLAATDRAAALTRQLLAFSRRQVLRPEVLDPGDVIECMAPVLRRLLGEHIELHITRDSAGHCVRADQSQLEQIVLNLCVNARDAMPDGGSLDIGIGTVLLTAPDIEGHALEPGAHVRLTVADTGTGMDEAIQRHIFEPFFTTKPQGVGTGLGLATVYGIVRQSAGRILCDSATGAGTRFTIDLPEVASSAERDVAAPAGVAARGRERILVVEDEPAVLELVARMLRNVGYAVRTATSGREALDALLAGARVDLLLTDVRMPHMQGPELAGHARCLLPGVRVVYMSGFAGIGDEVARAGMRGRVLAKPFDAASLTAAVRAALDEAPGDAAAAQEQLGAADPVTSAR
jgi:hypothetical protein